MACRLRTNNGAQRFALCQRINRDMAFELFYRLETLGKSNKFVIEAGELGQTANSN